MNQQTARPQNTAVAPFDREKASQALVASTAGSIGQFVPTDFAGLMTVSDLMARSGAAVPKHLRQNPGACMSVAMTAFQNGFNPWLLAGDSYNVNDQLAYGAKSIVAMVNNSPALEGRLHYELSGDWPNRRCKVIGKFRSDARPKELEVKAETITTRNSPNWKQQPDVQLMYYSGRAWGRVYMPEVTLGLMAEDEAPELERAADGSYTPRRPARSDYADNSKTIDAEIVADQQDGGEADDGETTPQFALVDQAGEVVRETTSAGEWVDLYADLYRRLATPEERATVRENNADTWTEILDNSLVDDAQAVRAEIHAEAGDGGADDDGFPGDQPETGSVAWAIALIGKQFKADDLDRAVATIKQNYWGDYSTEDKQRVSTAKITQQQRINGG